MDNIAEGFERDGNRELIQFLSVSKGSLGEVRSQISRLVDRNIINQQEFEDIERDCLFLAGKISNFITYLTNSGMKGNKYKDRNST